MRRRPGAGFTLVEVLVALVVVAIGLAALMTAVSGVARTSGYLRDKTLAQWIALNRLAEVRLTVNKIAQSGGQIATQGINQVGGTSNNQTSNARSGDAGELKFAGRTWHYDTRYYDTTVQSMKRIVVRVWLGDSKTKGNPLAETTGFYGAALSIAGNSNALDWTQGTTAVATPCSNTPGTGAVGTAGAGVGTPNCTPGNQPGTSPAPQ